MQNALGRISPQTVDDSGIKLKLSGGVLRRAAGSSVALIEGTDTEGQPWKVRIPTVKGIGGSTAFAARLDDDAHPDFFVIHSYAENGRCAPQWGLSIIMFDANGKPVPWYGRAFIKADIWGDGGVLDWADWDGDGGVELILSECYNYDYQTAHSSYPKGGFGLQAVYEASGGYWRKLPVEDRKRFESSYEKVLARGNRPSAPRPAEPLLPLPPDLSNDPANGRRVDGFRAIRGEDGWAHSGGLYETIALRRRLENHFQLGSGEFCYGHPVVVADRAGGREIDTDGHSDRAWTIFEEISSDDYVITLTGQTEEGLCSPAVVWAQQR